MLLLVKTPFFNKLRFNSNPELFNSQRLTGPNNQFKIFNDIFNRFELMLYFSRDNLFVLFCGSFTGNRNKLLHNCSAAASIFVVVILKTSENCVHYRSLIRKKPFLENCFAVGF